MPIILQTTEYNLIYLLSSKDYPGLVKVGKTTVKASNAELLEPNSEALIDAVKKRYASLGTVAADGLKLEYSEVAWFRDQQGLGYSFDDHDVHNVLVHSHYERVPITSFWGEAEEWFRIDVETGKKAIQAVKQGQEVIDGPVVEKKEKVVIRFRGEQERAISETIATFETREKKLWNAKMRFGKTLCAHELIRRAGYGRTLILTHRPAVRQGWFEDYHKLPFENYQYGSKIGEKYPKLDEKDFKGKDFKSLEEDYTQKGIRYIYFASMQDLRGSKDAQTDKSKGIDKNSEVFTTPWDLIILDEAHEGTQTELGKNVISELIKDKSPKLLYLSGTPFNILSQFEDDEIYTWDYVMEQEAKEKWPLEHPNERNPYEGLAKLSVFAYNLGDVFEINNYTRSEDDYFNFAELFRVWTGSKQKDNADIPAGASKGDFVHKEDVLKFLDMLCDNTKESFYPYSNAEFCQALSHTLWMVPGVAQADALKRMIDNHRIHTELGYEVISVAGEGSKLELKDEDDSAGIEKIEKDALRKVQTAVKKFPKTITLSCGRLTTGVSVPEWTGVFMLSGGYSTSAANYMQTIFRGQTPYKNGAIKTNCYAFDFAPDRTLTVIDEWIESQPGNKGPHEKGPKIESTLKFLSVISMAGGKEEPFSAKSFIESVNKALADFVVSHGFKGRKLTKDFSSWTLDDFKLIAEIGKVLGNEKGVKIGANGEVVVAKGGMTGDSSKPKGHNGGKKKGGKKGTPGIDGKKKNEESDKRRRAQNILDQIYVRLPLLLFGAVDNAEGLTIDELLDNAVIDNESWNEFMPQKFTKAMMKQIAHLIRVDALIASTSMTIKTAKEADSLSVEERAKVIAALLATFHFPDKETILTPWRVVNMHLSQTIGGYDFYDEEHCKLIEDPRYVEIPKVTSTIFWDENTRLLEINSKSGVYPLYLAYSLYRIQCEMSSEELTPLVREQIWNHVLNDNIFVICKTEMAKKITNRVLRGYKDIPTHCEVYKNLVPIIKNDEGEKKRQKLIEDLTSTTYWQMGNGKGDMKFNAIVSNPPYQVIKATDKAGANNSFATAIYPAFIQLARSLKPDYISMITPSRWMTKTGQGINEEWAEELISSNHFISLTDYYDASVVFAGIEIKGGVSYFLYSNAYSGKCHYSINQGGKTASYFDNLNFEGTGIVIRDEFAINILRKVIAVEGESFLDNNFSDFVGPQHFFDKDGLLTTSWRGYSLEQDTDHSIKYYLNKNLISSGYAWIKRCDIPKGHASLPLHKIYISKAYGAGDSFPHQIIGIPFYGEPNSVCSQTYLIIGHDPKRHSLSKSECESIISYIKTRFFRYLVSIKKKTQDNPSSVFQFVPIQDWSTSWTDKELYKKYNLSKDEIEYIESMIKPMGDDSTEPADNR